MGISKDKFMLDQNKPSDETRNVKINKKLLEALQGLLDAFIHIPGDKKGNKARTDIFKYGQGKGGMAEATTKARNVIYHIKKATI